MNPRLFLAILLPFVACGVQWLLWESYINPYVWFLFFPAAFFSAWLGGLRGGLAGTVIGALLVWFVYIPPQFSFELKSAAAGASIILFIIMGGLFAWLFERLSRATHRTEEALAETRAANDKINALYRKTLELDELKSQFFANVSHELRTPLTLIMAPLEQRLRHEKLTVDGRNETEMMLRNVRLLYRHVADLLDAAKLEAGGMRIDYARLDLVALVRGMAAHFDSMARERGIGYRIETPPALPTEADGEKLQRLTLNLLSNAFKFTPDGGNITIRLRTENGLAQLEVQDDGPGVPEDMREAVFERFRQVEGGMQRRHGGTGLGLSIVREFTVLHGGTATVDEAPGGGALFIVSIPLAAPAGTPVAASTSQIDSVIQREMVDELQSSPKVSHTVSPDDAPLVLVVEDNADMNAFIANALRPRYRVASAFDGREGLQKATDLAPDLILSDVMMPLMSGDEMVLELRQHNSLADTPIVMLTAKADEALKVRMLQAGVQDYLNKPFTVDELLARIGGLLRARRRSLEELQRSEALLKKAQHIAHLGNWTWDFKTDLPVWSDEMYHILGRDPALPPANFKEVPRYYTPESWARLSAAVEQTMRTGAPYVLDAEIVRDDGSHGWVAARGEAVHNESGAIVSLQGMMQDITDRRQSEERFTRLFHEAPVPLCYVSSNGTLTDRNKRFDQLFGYSHEELRTLDDWWPLAYPDPGYRAWVLETWNAAVAHAVETKSDIEPIEYEVCCKNGERRIVLISGITIGEDFLATFHDMTERRQTEEEIRQLNAGLERRVAERTVELTAANRELDSFAYAVSHDLRAPLRAMNGFSQAMVEDYGDKLESEAQEYLQQIDIASRKMSELVDGLLTLSRSTRGEMRRDPVDLSAMAKQLVEELKKDDPARRATVDITPGLTAHGDVRMLESVLRNLLGNAWKYSAHASAAHIRFFAELRDGTQWYCIADNGAGFDMAHAERLFQPFQRLHRQDEFPGIGIGLATVQRIVHRHGGLIEARGEVGKGAVFCFTLPAGSSDPAKESA